MSHNIYLGNLPEWVTADDIRSWLDSSGLVCDGIRVIRDFETQQSKGYAFVEAPNEEEMNAIIHRFNRAPLDGKLLRAKTAHPKGERPAAAPRSATEPRSATAAPRRKKRKREDVVAVEGGAERKSSKPETVGTLGEALQKAL
jgi:RNA recognition motif-containing protein